MFIQVGAFIVNLRLLDPFSLLVEQLAIAAVASYSCKWDHALLIEYARLLESIVTMML